MLRSLRHRDFRRFWLGFGVAVAGFQIQRVGLGVLAYDLTGSALFLALVFGGDSIPMLLFSPLGGVLSDRVNRKTLLLASRCCVALLALAIALLVAAGTIATWHLLLFALLTGICYALDVPARSAMVHDLVPGEDLVNAIALTSTIRQGMRIAGPAIGSLAILTVGVQGTFALMAAAQAVSVLTITSVRLPHTARRQTESAFANLREGMCFIAAHEAVWTLLIISAAPALTAMAYQSLTPVFAKEVLGRGDAAIGVMFSAAGAGALAGSVWIAAQASRGSSRTLAAWSAIAFGASVAAFALSRSFALSLTLMALAGMTGAVYTIAVSSAIQQRAPAAMQGRVMGVYQTTWELQVFGSLLVGAFADLIGAPAALALAGLANAAILALLVLRSGRGVRPD